MATPIVSSTVSSLRPRVPNSVRLFRSGVDNYEAAQQALLDDKLLDALEYGYRAALRLAGARVADSPVAKRRRLPRSAWDQLRLVDQRGADYADLFEAFSRVRQRALNGLDRHISPARVGTLMRLVESFLDDVDEQLHPTSTAA
ncbi:SAV_6107 family HEPN domain-containing protein [Corynebacterium sp. TAE3-ERU30]|uniref:SAV_6107 family HEPN domain-containing protein n=1 Tax=Corynebacterium sp. TAE3-ERU30 TaxID=2849496 RepID=UPI001C43BF16|nr:SAV_6107 family HEPN domain-containing protein [Corynebacterium sp. TAE3-ERU30]MBV7281664.1 hypothetical protein [Corynebacterium sp. TAE3-ERU30]